MEQSFHKNSIQTQKGIGPSVGKAVCLLNILYLKKWCVDLYKGFSPLPPASCGRVSFIISDMRSSCQPILLIFDSNSVFWKWRDGINVLLPRKISLISL